MQTGSLSSHSDSRAMVVMLSARQRGDFFLEEGSAAWFKYAAFRRALGIEEKRPYAAPEGQGAWWWCLRLDGTEDFFLEASSTSWFKCEDLNSGRHYWQNESNQKFFFV